MTEQPATPTAGDNRGWFRRTLTIIAGSGVILGALVLNAPVASAEPVKPIKESTIKSECKAAGGTYGTKTVEGTRFSACHYKDNEGNGFSDFYLNGGYYSTRPW
jgi:hypothetical protein